VQRELHNDEILKQLKDSASELEHEIRDVAAPVTQKISALEQEVRAQSSMATNTEIAEDKPVESKVEQP
jgi:hypothetical protein